MRLPYLSCALITVLSIVAPGCSSDGSSSSSTTAPTPALSTDVLTGTVQPPIGSALQSSFNPFTVGQGGGSVQVTLTSAIETFPDGSRQSTVTMGLGIGTVTAGACALLQNAFTPAQGGSSPQLNGTLNAGGYCVQVSDVTNQLGPVAYAVAVTHP
jgi:hypothetical protein